MYLHVEMHMSALDQAQDLKFTVILSACDLAFALLSRDSLLLDANKDKLWTILLDFMQLFCGKLHDTVN